VFTKYVEAAMSKANYEIMEDGEFFGEIPGFQGVFGSGSSLTACQDQLRSVLEGWLILGLWDNDPDLPVVDRMSLIPRRIGRSKSSRATTQQTRNRKAS
jgi:predicted RNase H-like HicB family nuclease